MKNLPLYDLFKAMDVQPDEEVEWRYYGYGFLDSTGKCKVKDVPKPVLCSKCFKFENSTFYIDGAL